MAGKNAGMTVIAVDDQYSAFQEDEKRELADHYIYDYGELIS
jgi:16S rRNA pseudouridine516 synthase